jgi:hypothetical protein
VEVVAQDVDRVLVDVLEDDEVVEAALVELVVICVELDAEAKLELVDVELMVVGVELLVVNVVEDFVVDVRLEELEGPGLEAVRAKYAPIPATAMMMITIAAIAVRAIPPLSCRKKGCLRVTLFNTRQPFPDMAIIYSHLPRSNPDN